MFNNIKMPWSSWLIQLRESTTAIALNFVPSREYRISTEDVNPEETLAIIVREFPDNTVRSVIGYYNGIRENSIEVVIIGKALLKRVVLVAALIKDANAQQAVLITVTPVREIWI